MALYPAAMFRATADRADARGLVLKDNLFDFRQWLRLGVRVVERRTHVKTKSLISWLAMLALVFGAQPGVTADGDSQKKKPLAQDTYTITQLDTGANVASSGQLISDNQVVAGNLQGDALFAFAWSAQTGFVVLTLGGSSSLVSGMSSNGTVTGAADTPGETEVIGFIWTPANGLVTIGNLGGGYTVPQGVNSSGVVIGDAITAEGRDHAFMWTEAGGMVDLDPTGLADSAARFVTEDGSLIIGSIYAETGQRVFAWTKTTGLTDIGTLGRDMLPEHMNRQGALTGRFFREDGTSGTFFWSQANGLEEIDSLGGDEMSPTAINDAGTIVGFGTTASGETHGFVWSKANGLVDIGTLGGDFSWASDVNSSGLVAGYSKTAAGDEHAIAWSADGGLIDLGTLDGSRSRGQFVTEAGAIIGVSGAKGHRTHAFVWTEASGLVEMPSLGRLENVGAASRTGAFTGFTIDKKSNGLYAVLWAPSPASSKQ